MLTVLNFDIERLNAEHIEKGVNFTKSEMFDDNNKVLDFIECRTIPNHPFWVANRPEKAHESMRVFCLAAEREIKGLYWGWSIEYDVKRYSDYDLECRFANFNETSGKYYSDDAIRAAWNGDNPEEVFGLMGAYGSADNIEQVLKRYEAVIANPDVNIIIQLGEINKETDGGWRWHKNGPYIGDKEPQYEYFKDEPDFESIITFHVLVLKKKGE